MKTERKEKEKEEKGGYQVQQLKIHRFEACPTKRGMSVI
jgi:hypothetical protein